MRHDVDGKYSVGKIFKNKKDEEFEIIEYVNRRNRRIRFVETAYENIVLTSQIYNRSIRDNSAKHKCDVGEKFKTNEGYYIEIVDYIDKTYRIVMFQDIYKYKVKVSTGAILRGNIKNPYHKSIYSIGYVGDGEFNESNSIEIYNKWYNMMSRCYSKTSSTKFPTYTSCIVCKEWHNFQNFAKWYKENYPYDLKNVKFELDKDLLQQDVENKIYSHVTCVFVPKKVNIFLANKRTKNTSGYTGVSFDNEYKKWRAQINDFKTNKRVYLGSYSNIDDAINSYKRSREIQAFEVRAYMKNLNYLSSEIVELIK